MAKEIDILNPTISVIANGLEAKVLLIYGHNNLGKTFQSVRMPKPFIIACESGLNGISGVPYARITKWSEFKAVVRQFTSPLTVDQAKEKYSTIIIDEVYASSLFCQDYIIDTYGKGALTLGDATGKVNLYQMYEKEYFRMVNLLVSAGYTIVFIAHEETKENYSYPKGDKRCISPIVDACDFCIYLQANGVDESGKVIPSSAYLAETDTFFARSRFKYVPTCIPEFTAANLEKAIIEGIKAEEKESGLKNVDYITQQKMNTTVPVDFDSLMDELAIWGEKLVNAKKRDLLTEIIEQTLGAGHTVREATKKQTEALEIILDDIKAACQNEGIE